MYIYIIYEFINVGNLKFMILSPVWDVLKTRMPQAVGVTVFAKACPATRMQKR